MAPRPLSQFDPLDSHDPDDSLGSGVGSERKPPELSVVAVSSSPNRPAGDSGLLPEDPAWQEMVEEARRLTGASAAALALGQQDEMVCRATTGASAPALGTHLNLDSWLSGACAKTKTFQRCDDSEIDARVDAAFCRRLGIRSILVFPILLQDELLGIVEVFASRPNAFADIHVLQSLSHLVANNLVLVTHAAIKPEVVPPPPKIEPAEEPQPDVFLPSASPELPVQELAVLREDYWTTALTFVVIALALALGWLLGLGVQRASMPRPQKAESSATSGAAAGAAPTQPAPSTAVVAPAVVPASASAKIPPVARPAPKPKHVKAAELSSSDLVVSQNGKVIYREAPPTMASGQSSKGSGSPGPAQPAGKLAMSISPKAANRFLTHRVEPEYPEQAREQHVQGPVTLKVTVNKNGSVRTLKTMRGNPQLAAAASRAVRQWRFKPVMQHGSPAEFQTDVTVVFRLP